MKQVIDVIEVGKVGIHLDDPVRYTQYHRSNVDQGYFSGEERLVFYPRDDIMHDPGNVEEDSCNAEIPSIGFPVCEYECSVWHAKDELQC